MLSLQTGNESQVRRWSSFDSFNFPTISNLVQVAVKQTAARRNACEKSLLLLEEDNTDNHMIHIDSSKAESKSG